MISIISIILPVFALISLGWAVGRTALLGPAATNEINRFVVYLALPALLFDTVANSTLAQIWQPGFVAAFTSGMALVFLATAVFGIWRSRPLADAAIDGLNAAYPNTGFMGFPLALAVLGPAAFAPTLIANLLTVCILFAAGIAMIEFGLDGQNHAGRVAIKVLFSVTRNPVVMAPCFGLLLLATHISIPAPIESAVKMLGGAASPCALVSLGLFLALPLEKSHPNYLSVSAIVASKLIIQPVLTWFFSAIVFHLSPLHMRTAVLIAALPAGTGPFMLAKFYQVNADLTSRVVLISTIISIATISLYLTIASPS